MELIGQLLMLQRDAKGSQRAQLTPSPKNTMSGLTNPRSFSSFPFSFRSVLPVPLQCTLSHLGMAPSLTVFFIRSPSYGLLHSIHLWVAKLPCASIILSAGTPARRSSVSMFCVKHVCRRDLDARSWMKECVRVGRNLPGYNSFASM